MSKEFDEMVAHLKWLNFWIRHSCDQAVDSCIHDGKKANRPTLVRRSETPS